VDILSFQSVEMSYSNYDENDKEKGFRTGQTYSGFEDLEPYATHVCVFCFIIHRRPNFDILE